MSCGRSAVADGAGTYLPARPWALVRATRSGADVGAPGQLLPPPTYDVT